MRISPAITLGLSVAFGFAAVLAARYFTTRDAEPAPVELVEAPIIEMISVVVAAEDIGRGDTVSEVNLMIEDWPAAQAPYGRFSSIAAVGSDQFSPRQAMTVIAAGEPVLDSRLSPAGMRPSLAGRLEPGYRAFTISMNDVAGVAGFVLPGDRVDVLHTRNSNLNGRTKNLVSDILLSDIEVLGLGLNDDVRSNQPSEFHNATLAVSVEDARKLAVAGETGNLSLALRGTRDRGVVDVITARATPVRRPRRRAVAATPRVKRPVFDTVQVILGETKTDYTVPEGRLAGAPTRLTPVVVANADKVSPQE